MLLVMDKGCSGRTINKDDGGTCINIGCIPTKTLIHDGIEGNSFKESITRKRSRTSIE